MKLSSLALLATLLSTALCASVHAAAPAPASCCPAPKSKAPMTTASFAQTVATVDLLEIKLGQVAQTNASLPSVKKFGAYMVKSHTAINASLTKLAAAEKISIPTTLDTKHQAVLNKLSKLKGAAFDKAYIPAMVDGHTKVLAMFKDFCACCTDPGFKKFAKKTTPIIADHLKAAQKVQAEMTKTGLL